jgi:flagellar basal-body rod modification protein FlgD
MTTVPSTGSTSNSNANSSSSSSSSTSSTTTLDYNSFLQLLIAQLQNQDPLNPTDSTEFVSQLASFSSVEQGVNTNSKLDQLLVNANLTQASTMVGLKVTSADGTVSGTIASIKVDSSGSTAVLTDGTNVPLGSGVTIGFP